MKSFLKSVVMGTTPALMVAGALRGGVPIAESQALDAPSSQPSTQPSTQPTSPPLILQGVNGFRN